MDQSARNTRILVAAKNVLYRKADGARRKDWAFIPFSKIFISKATVAQKLLTIIAISHIMKPRFLDLEVRVAHNEPFPTPLRAYGVPDMRQIAPVMYGVQREMR